MKIATGEIVSVTAHYLGKPWYKLIIRMLARGEGSALYICRYTLFGTPSRSASFPLAQADTIGIRTLVERAVKLGDLKLMKEVISAKDLAETNGED